MKSPFVLAAAILGIVAAAPSHAQSVNPLITNPSASVGLEPLLLGAGSKPQDDFALEPFLGAGDKPPVTIDVVLGYASLGMTAILLHEIGHALVDAYQIPIAGSEEDAVDEFAAIVLIHNAELDPANHDTLSAMVRYFLDVWTLQKPDLANDVTAAYWDTHSIGRKRAYDILCLMVGAFPERYGAVLEAHTDNPEQLALTRASCVAQYERKAEAWDRLLFGILKPVQAAPAPGEPRFVLESLPPQSDLGVFFDLLNEAQPILPPIVDWLNSVFALPAGTGDIRIEAGECGGPANAFYSYARRTVTYCDELTAALALWFVNAETGEDLDSIDGLFDWFVWQQAREAKAALAGAWTAPDVSADGHDLKLSLRFNTDETFRQIETDGSRAIMVDGKFSVEALLLGPVVLTFRPLVWSPARICNDPDGTDCRDVKIPESWTLKLTAWRRDAVVLGGRTYQRDPDPPPTPIVGRWSGDFRKIIGIQTPRLLLKPDVTVTFQPDFFFDWSGQWPDSRGCRIEATGTYADDGDKLSLRLGPKPPTMTDPGCNIDALPQEATFRIGTREGQRLSLGNGSLENLELEREGSGLLSLAPRR